METHFWRRHSAGQTRGAPAAPAPRPRRRPGASGSTATAVVTASPHSPRHHHLCPWTREARAGPRGAPGRQALSVPMLLPRQGARGPRPDRPAPSPAQHRQCGPGHSHLTSLQLSLLAYETEQKRAVRSRPALGARPAREAVAVTSAPQLRLRTAGPAPVPAGSSPGGSVLTVPEPAKGRLCHTPVPRADGAQAASQGFSARGPEPGSADRSFRKEREATGSARNRAARRVATGSGAPRPDGRAQRCVRRELTVPCPSGSYLSHPA